MVWAGVDGPTPQDVASKGCPSLNLQHAGLHGVIGLNRIGLLDARMGNDFQIHYPRPLFIGTEKFARLGFAI